MDRPLRKLCQQALEAREIATLDNQVAGLKTFICHIDQEPGEYKTYRRAGDRERRNTYTAFEELIEKTSLEAYLDRAVDVEEEARLPASCKQFTMVTAHLGAVLLGQEGYIIGRVNPAYARINQPDKRIHHLNAYFNGKRFVFFDSSVYRQIRRKKKGELKWLPPTKSFNPADINFKKFVQWGNWLQKGRIVTPEKIDTNYTANKKHFPQEYTRIITP